MSRTGRIGAAVGAAIAIAWGGHASADGFFEADTEAQCYAAMKTCVSNAEAVVSREPAATWNRRLNYRVNLCEQTGNACADELRGTKPRLPVRKVGTLNCDSRVGTELFTDEKGGSWCKVGGRYRGCRFGGNFVEYKVSGLLFSDSWTLDIDDLQYDRLKIDAAGPELWKPTRSSGSCHWGVAGDNRPEAWK